MRSDLYPTGRKHCSLCGCWRLVYEFGRASKPGILQAQCKTCDRVKQRERKGYRPQRIGYCLRGHKLTPDNIRDRGDGRRQCLTCRRMTDRRWWHTLGPEKKAQRREWERIYEDAKRRARGAPRRNTRGRREHAPRSVNEKLNLPAKPFALWLRETAEMEDGSPTGEWCRQVRIDQSAARRLVRGEQTHVHIDTVDRTLIEEGSTFLWDLYPELYEEAA